VVWEFGGFDLCAVLKFAGSIWQIVGGKEQSAELFSVSDGRILISWALWKLAILDFSWISEITVRIKINQVWVTD